jgi:glycosyltransferase involved in cell wall biosynthesis
MAKNSPIPSRLILCDPVCVLPYGHNVAALGNFARFIGQNFTDVIAIGCRYLPDAVAQPNSIRQEFDFYYNDAIPIDEDGEELPLPVSHEEKVAAAKADLLNILARYKVRGGDYLCYPSIDFYALYALASSTEELRKAGSPTLMIRLIGVMETAVSGNYTRPFDVMLTLLGRIQSSGLPVRFAAETPRYAEYLSIHLDSPVAVAPNIETREQMPLPNNGCFTVICPGSARYDKGFLTLHEIFSNVRRDDPDLRIRFRTQLLPDIHLKHHLGYLQRLYAVPGVEILPAQISPSEMEAMYDEADLVLLPYARDVYEFRGSAVLIEATCTGRHALALEGPAFVDQMRYFGSGTVCLNPREMAEQILNLSRQSAKLRFAKARQARDRFTRDLEDSYRHWMSAP